MAFSRVFYFFYGFSTVFYGFSMAFSRVFYFFYGFSMGFSTVFYYVFRGGSW